MALLVEGLDQSGQQIDYGSMGGWMFFVGAGCAQASDEY